MFPQSRRIPHRGESVIISNEIESLPLFLELDCRAECPEIIPNVQGPCRLESGEITHHGGTVSKPGTLSRERISGSAWEPKAEFRRQETERQSAETGFNRLLCQKREELPMRYRHI